MEGAACPDVDIVFNCTTDVTTVDWTAEPFFSREILTKLSQVGIRNSGPITIERISLDPFTSTLTITYSNVLNSTEVICSGGSNLGMSITYRRQLGKYYIPNDTGLIMFGTPDFFFGNHFY